MSLPKEIALISESGHSTVFTKGYVIAARAELPTFSGFHPTYDCLTPSGKKSMLQDDIFRPYLLGNPSIPSHNVISLTNSNPYSLGKILN